MAIQVEGLRKSFTGVDVLKGVDFEVRRGEIFALLGSNGAGKTTTIKTCSTLIKPDSGTACGCAVWTWYANQTRCARLSA